MEVTSLLILQYLKLASHQRQGLTLHCCHFCHAFDDVIYIIFVVAAAASVVVDQWRN
jgi:hypothetical protein